MRYRVLLALLAVLTARPGAAQLPPPWLPLDPGAAQCASDAQGAALGNAALRFAVKVDDRHLLPAAFDNGITRESRALGGALFTVTPREGAAVGATRFVLAAPPACSAIAAHPDAARAAERRAGQVLDADLTDGATGLKVHWRAVLRDGTNYVRAELTFEAPADLDLSRVALIALDLPGAYVEGTAPGSPIIAGNAFFAFEHPMAEADAEGGHAVMMLRRALPLRAGVPVQYSAVLGVLPRGERRRGFAAYLENERATPFRTFLHYNSWYDIGYFTPYTEADALHVIRTFGERLVRAHHVRMDSFLFDDGWDDTHHLWQFNAGFPHGFTPLREAAEPLGAGVGVWLSPWGGYGKPRRERLATAQEAGYEVDEQGIALSGAKYYALFHEAALRLLREDGVNQFKLDGTGSPDKVTPGSAFDSDFAAAIALIGDLRAVKPDLFVNLTTGTWPSPFWLRSADSIWRGGEDHSFAGTGSDRQRWITYRDADTYGGIVRQGPLFPLNSLMLHGIIYARHAHGLDTDPYGDFPDEVHDYFASGTGLQELYISPDLLTERNWDTLAEAANWARARAAVLRDS
ncbi:MAG: enterotoxin, partial [Gammaproteobacteria bacterium]|nr:enterotoxin [Gammaproteobacteria bacterium]